MKLNFWIKLILPLLLFQVSQGFRLVTKTGEGDAFEPGEQGFVGFYGDPGIFKKERINEGGPSTVTQPLQFEDTHPRRF